MEIKSIARDGKACNQPQIYLPAAFSSHNMTGPAQCYRIPSPACQLSIQFIKLFFVPTRVKSYMTEALSLISHSTHPW